MHLRQFKKLKINIHLCVCKTVKKACISEIVTFVFY